MSDLAAPIWRDGAFRPDDWLRSGEAALAAGGAKLLAPAAVFLAGPEPFLSRQGQLGVELAAGEAAASLEPYLARLDLIALVFPKFSDGRSYSAARLLRERFGYRGELRATGDVLSDQIPQMRRCGIDSFEVHHLPTRAALLTGRLAEVRHYYQPVAPAREIPAGARPWLRQPAR